MNDPKQQASTDKAPLQLLPPIAMHQIAHILSLSANECGVYNWRKNINSIEDPTYYGAILQHVTAMMDGEPCDPESSRSHWAHIGATAMIMLDVLHQRNLI